MPVYHFTFHAYGTWLPDRPEGYIRRGEGIQRPDPTMAERYRSDMQQAASRFSSDAQQRAIHTLIASQPLQHFVLYAAAAESSHLHVLVSWIDGREPIRVRTQIKTSMTRALNLRFGKRKWFVRNAGQTRVEDKEHLHHLVHVYLPSHGGAYWCRSVDGKRE